MEYGSRSRFEGSRDEILTRYIRMYIGCRTPSLAPGFIDYLSRSRIGCSGGGLGRWRRKGGREQSVEREDARETGGQRRSEKAGNANGRS